MSDYVYALHDFVPENEDELPFRAGERIEIVERDDMYGDGWWKGQNLAGKIGLFPQSYTAPALPSADSAPMASTSSSTIVDKLPEPAGEPSKSILQPLEEVPEHEAPQVTSPLQSPQIAAPVPTPAAILVDGEKPFDDGPLRRRTASGSDGEVMKATMTDVQTAIEQLGRRGLTEDQRSFSFASSRDGETDTDFDLSDMEAIDSNGGESWHVGARKRLAAKARKAVEEAEKMEAMLNGSRVVAPPIDVELSDESDDEHHEHEDQTAHSALFRREQQTIPYIAEEDEESEANVRPISLQQNHTTQVGLGLDRKIASSPEALFVEPVLPPSKEEVREPQTVPATHSTFSMAPSPSPSPTPSPTPMTPTVMPSMLTPNGRAKDRLSFPGPLSSTVQTSNSITTPPRSDHARSAMHKRNSFGAMPAPSPRGVFNGRSQSLTRQGSTPSVRPSSPFATPPPVMAPPAVQTTKAEQKDKTPIAEWGVDEVVEWLKSKSFDSDVCDKFREQEITGDVLLELDISILKLEIGIMAYGKRTRIINAIADLKRPPSITYSDQAEQQPSPLSPMIQGLPAHTHSRTQSQTHSHSSYPGATNGYHSHSQSIQSSLGSPLPTGGSPSHSAALNGQFAPAIGGFVPMSGSDGSARSSGIGTGTVMDRQEGSSGMGGLEVPTPTLNGRVVSRQPQLSLSPSDTALSDTVRAVANIPEEREDDRGHMSEGEIGQRKIGGRLFGRSQDLNVLKETDTNSKAESARSDPLKPIGESKDLSSPTRSMADESANSRHARSKKSVDGAKGHDRLSIFGNPFGPSIGKSRKPAPRFSGDEILHEKGSMFALPKLSGSNRRPSSIVGSQRSAVASATAVSSKDSGLLRKQSISGVQGTARPSGGIGNTLKPGVSVINQIGQPDHNGWLRKKSDRYNSWKLRYFILKGPDLYCLRTNNKTETKIKGYICITGYKVTVDENIDPGRYGFRIDHDSDKSYYFSSDERSLVREWMKAIMKATIGRDYARPVISSCNIPTIPLAVAQAMNPAPRPPSPTAREATQRALRRENPDQLSSRDAQILMGLPSGGGGAERTRLEGFLAAAGPLSGNLPKSSMYEDDHGGLQTPRAVTSALGAAPPRPSREMRRIPSQRTGAVVIDDDLLAWANSHLPMSLQVRDSTGPLYGGLALLRLGEFIKGKPVSPPVPDSAFPASPSDDKLDGLFNLFDFLLDNDVKIGSVSINDVRLGKRDKIVQLLKALKAWEDRRRALAQNIARSSVQASGFMAPVGSGWA